MASLLESIDEVGNSLELRNEPSIGNNLSSSIEDVQQKVVGNSEQVVGEDQQVGVGDQDDEIKKKSQGGFQVSIEQDRQGEEGQKQGFWNWIKKILGIEKRDGYVGDSLKVSPLPTNDDNKEEEQRGVQKTRTEEKTSMPLKLSNEEEEVAGVKPESPERNKGEEAKSTGLSQEEKEVSAVVKLLNGIKDKANGDEGKQKEMLDKASKLVADTRDPDLIKGWNEVLGKAAEQNPELKDMANDLSGQIAAKDQAKGVADNLSKSSSVQNVDQQQSNPTLERLAADHHNKSPDQGR